MGPQSYGAELGPKLLCWLEGFFEVLFFSLIMTLLKAKHKKGWSGNAQSFVCKLEGQGDFLPLFFTLKC